GGRARTGAGGVRARKGSSQTCLSLPTIEKPAPLSTANSAGSRRDGLGLGGRTGPAGPAAPPPPPPAGSGPALSFKRDGFAADDCEGRWTTRPTCARRDGRAALLLGEAKMLKKWMGVALLAGWLGLTAQARAQYLPSPVGAARIPEPLPCGPTAPVPNLVPGPLNPLDAPKGPPDCLSLPAGINNA